MKPGDVAPVGWHLAPHVCRACGGRVLQRREAPDGRPSDMFRCSGCGSECRGVTMPGHTGLVPKAICGCGMPGSWTGRARPRCVPNPDRGIWKPAEYVIATTGDPPHG